MTIGLSTIERHKPGKPARDPRSLDERGGPTRAPPPKPPTPPQRTTGRPTAPPTGQRTTTGRPTASTTAPTAPTTSQPWTAQDYAVAGGVVALIGVIAWSIYK